MSTVLFQAAPFCFGPAATTLNVIEALAPYGHRLRMLATSSALDLAARSSLPIELLEGTADDLPTAARGVDLVVSNTDLAVAARCAARGLPVVVIDTLFWMWDRVEPAAMDCERYIVQEFPGTQAQLERLGSPARLARVGPLVRPQRPPAEARGAHVLISLGGSDCELVDVERDPYPAFVARAALAAAPPGTTLVVCTGQRAAQALRRVLPASVEVCTLSNREHVERMRTARAVLASPGITGAMELFDAGTPLFFLPPQNYSQVLQLVAYRQAGVAPFGLTWRDVRPGWALEPYLSEPRAVAALRSIVESAARDTATRQRLEAHLGEFFRRGIAGWNPGPGRAFRASLGTRGPARAAELIDRTLRG